MKERENKDTSVKNQAETERELRKKAAEEELRAVRRVQEAKLRDECKIAKEKLRAERKKKRCKGFGGWLTATVALSVTVLVLGALLTVGYYDLADANRSAEGGYRELVYELSEQLEYLDSDFAKARMLPQGSASRGMLSDALVRCRLAEEVLEKFPSDSHASERLTEFFNRSGDCVSRVLVRGRADESDREQLEYFYQSLESMREKMPALTESVQCSVGAMLCADGDFARAFEEFSLCFGDLPQSKTVEHASAEMIRNLPETNAAAAEEKVRELFSKYNPQSVKTTGETLGDLPCFTVEFSDADGREYSVYLTKNGGIVAMFESCSVCENERYSEEDCIEIAHTFLEKCGYSGMKAVWQSSADGGCCVTFVPESESVLIYSDRVTVNVCCERGVVTGMNGVPFLKNHRERAIGEVSVSAEEAERASGLSEVRSVRSALIVSDGEEMLAFEVFGTYGGREYFVYVDANTGAVTEVKLVALSDRGRVLR